ncbi:hypothetical protein D3C75_997770 [compost metagenome]
MLETVGCLLLFAQGLAKGFTVLCVRAGQPVRKLLRDQMVDGVGRDTFDGRHVVISGAEKATRASRWEPGLAVDSAALSCLWCRQGR